MRGGISYTALLIEAYGQVFADVINQALPLRRGIRAAPDAYQTLILDVIQGEQTLFVRSDEVEAAWQLFDPLTKLDREVHLYPAGTWGPAVADELLIRDGRGWTIR